MSQTDTKMLESCAEICHVCQDACLRTIVHCLGIGGEHASLEHQTTLADCAAICGVSHNFLHRQSPRHEHTCRACAEVCRACAASCRQLGTEDRVMTACATLCDKCAHSCEEMAA